MRIEQLREVTSWLGKRSYEVRVARFGIERIREIARENGEEGRAASKERGCKEGE